MPRDLNRTLFIGLLFLIAPLAGCVSENEDSDAGGRNSLEHKIQIVHPLRLPAHRRSIHSPQVGLRILQN